MESNLVDSSMYESVEYSVGVDEVGNDCGVDIGGICGQLQDDEQVVIKQSRVIVVTPESKRKGGKDGNSGVSPEVGESVEPPRIGMLFESWKEVEVYYKRYGRQQGFGISRVQATLSKDKSHRRSMTWRCECWGDPEMTSSRASKKRARDVEVGGSSSVNEGNIRKRKSKKCNCPAMLYASINSNDTWEIKKVMLEHENHAPFPSQSKLVKEYRMESLYSTVRRRLLNDTACGVPVSKVFDCLARERNGVENMPYTEKDLRHVVDKERMLKMEGGDAKALLTYFEKLRKQDVNYFHEHRKPLEEVMPDTRHRWCIWNILQKLPKKFSKDERYEAIKEDLFQAVYNSWTVPEFESSWDEFMTKYSLHEHKWLSKMYVERLMWVPAFLKGEFWAGMRTTQRVESMNSFFDKFIYRHTRLCEFGERYCSALQRRVAQEKEADERDVKWIRKLSTGYSVEKVFRKVYTDNKYRSVQRECERIGYCVVREEKDIGPNKLFLLLEDRVWVLPKDCYEEVITNRRRMVRATYDAESKEVDCDCKMFETHGIPCHHIMRVWEHYYVDPIPEKYVIDRWRKDIIRKHSMISVAHFDLSKSLKVGRIDEMLSVVDPTVEIASEHDEPKEIVVRGMKAIAEEVQLWVKNNPEALGVIRAKDKSVSGSEVEGGSGSVPNQGTDNDNYAETQCSEVPGDRVVIPENMKDPPIPKKRGRPKCNRFKAIGEPGWKQANTSKSKSKSKSRSDGGVDEVGITENEDTAATVQSKKKQKKSSKKDNDGVVEKPRNGNKKSKGGENENKGKKKSVVAALGPKVEDGPPGKLQPKPKFKVLRQQKLEAFLITEQPQSYLEPVEDELLNRNLMSFL